MDEAMVQSDRVKLGNLEVDTIGEMLNISMGSAATAISSMLDSRVVISTPTVEVREFRSMDYTALEPALLVKIEYVEGISGNNVMIFRQRDIQIILNLLMGNDEEPTDDFEFDELSMSAACEVMNQMMGASATALSELLSCVVNISTPVASVVDSEHTYQKAIDVQEGDEIVAVSFHIEIEGVMNSNFASIMSCELVKEIVNRVLGQNEANLEQIEAPAPPAPPAPAPQAAPPQPAVPQQPMAGVPAAPPQTQAPAAPQQPPMAPPAQQDAAGAIQPPMGYPGMPPYGQPPYYMQQYPPYGAYPPYPQPPQQPSPFQAPVNVQPTQFPQFTVQSTENPASNFNMDLLMGVSLDVSVEIGQTKRKIKDIIDFGQGTVIELNKQAGAPVDIVVNGQLLARGDVVVIGDNFGVRITEIVGTKELMESLKEGAG